MALIFIILAIIFAVLAINLFSSANKHESRYNNTSKATNKKATSNGQSSANVATPPVVIVKSYWDAYKEKQASKAKVIENLWGLDFSKLSDKDVREKISSTERLSNNLKCPIDQIKHVYISNFNQAPWFKYAIASATQEKEHEAIKYDISPENTRSALELIWLEERQEQEEQAKEKSKRERLANTISCFEKEYNDYSRYSKDYKYSYSIPSEAQTYKLHDGCMVLCLNEFSNVKELYLPSSFMWFDVQSIRYLPNLTKIVSFSDFNFLLKMDEGEVIRYKFPKPVIKECVKDDFANLKEVFVLPCLVDKFKRIFGCDSESNASKIIVEETPDVMVNKNKQIKGLTINQSFGRDGKTIVAVDVKKETLDIPKWVSEVSPYAITSENILKTIIIDGDADEEHLDRDSYLEIKKETINVMTHLEKIVFKGPFIGHFYDTLDTKLVALRKVVYPLWNYRHICFCGMEADYGHHTYNVCAENFSKVELEYSPDGLIYSKDGKYLVSGVDCKSKKVHIKNGVEEIFQYAFCGNDRIEEIYIPHTVTQLGEYAFKACRNLRTVIFNFNSIKAGAEKAFFTFSPLLKLFLPNTGFSDAVKHECEFENIAIYHIPDIQGDITIDETTNNVYDSKGIKIGKAELYE
jgi:hypothetical protein